MGDFSDNIFLRAAFGVGDIEIPVTTSSSSPSTSTCASASGAATFSDAPQTSTGKRKCREMLQPRRRNANNRKYSKLEDHLILKAVELKGRDWRTVLAFFKSNWKVLAEEGNIYIYIYIYIVKGGVRCLKRSLHYKGKIKTERQGGEDEEEE